MNESKPETPKQFFRLFVAIRIPDSIKAGIEKVQADLRDGLDQAAVRWTNREQFHLTLGFLGNVEPDRVASLTEKLIAAGQQFAPMNLRVEGLGFFPERRLPRVVWMGVTDDAAQLPRLQQAVEGACGEFTAEKAEANFSGHVTLGRVKSIKRFEVEHLQRAAAGLAKTLVGTWTAREVELVRSELSAQGSRYTCMATVPLSKT